MTEATAIIPVGSAGSAEFLTIKEAAGLLKVSPWSVRQAIWRGQLRACLFGTRVRIRRVDLDEYLGRNIWSRELCRERTARPRPSGRAKKSVKTPSRRGVGATKKPDGHGAGN